jgi:hypothetical protein
LELPKLTPQGRNVAKTVIYFSHDFRLVHLH